MYFKILKIKILKIMDYHMVLNIFQFIHFKLIYLVDHLENQFIKSNNLVLLLNPKFYFKSDYEIHILFFQSSMDHIQLFKIKNYH